MPHRSDYISLREFKDAMKQILIERKLQCVMSSIAVNGGQAVLAIRCKGQARADILDGQLGILLDDFGFAHPLNKPV